jgi:tRNA G18 (ribose-2'-O)-methylase SpoU
MAELERKSLEAFADSPKLPIVIVLDNVRSMLNVGSVFRSADSFLIESIYLCGYTPVPPHRDIQKSALGATETVQWCHRESTPDAVRELQQMGFVVFSVEQAHQSLALQQMSVKPGERYALVFGNEVEGVSDEVIALSDGILEIPQLGSKHSLNIAVSAGIVLWELAKQYFTEVKKL